MKLTSEPAHKTDNKTAYKTLAGIVCSYMLISYTGNSRPIDIAMQSDFDSTIAYYDSSKILVSQNVKFQTSANASANQYTMKDSIDSRVQMDSRVNSSQTDTANYDTTKNYASTKNDVSDISKQDAITGTILFGILVACFALVGMGGMVWYSAITDPHHWYAQPKERQPKRNKNITQKSSR